MKNGKRTKRKPIEQVEEWQRSPGDTAAERGRSLIGRTLGSIEEQYRLIVHTAYEGIWVLDEDYCTSFVNRRMAEMLGYTREEMVGKYYPFFLFEEDIPYLQSKQARRRQCIAEQYECRLRRKDGSTVWVHVSASPILDKKGRFRASFAMFTDMTERKEAEEALRQSEAKYRDIFENAVEGMFQVTPEGRYLSVNPALAHIHGFASPREMIDSVTDIADQLYVDPDRRAELLQHIREKGFVKNFETIMRRRDAGLQWVSINSRGVSDHEGRLLYYEGTLQDITSRKVAEEELKQLRATLHGMAAALSSAVEIRDPGTAGHQRRVAGLAAAIGREMGLSDDTVRKIGLAGLVHDVGKIVVPVEILSKPGTLTEKEYELVKTHPEAGYAILEEAGLPHPVADMVLQHHERPNGAGYPRGLRDGAILLESRILAVADVVEAMASQRPYRPPRGLDAALEYVAANGGTLFDAEAARLCLKLFREDGLTLE